LADVLCVERITGTRRRRWPRLEVGAETAELFQGQHGGLAGWSDQDYSAAVDEQDDVPRSVRKVSAGDEAVFSNARWLRFGLWPVLAHGWRPGG
jgi:hypothetical protein